MKKMFRKKPVVIEAIQFVDSPECLAALSQMGLEPVVVDYAEQGKPIIKIGTLEGVMVGNVGDWIIRGVKGEFYPCKPDIFEATYIAAEAGCDGSCDCGTPARKTTGLNFGEAFAALERGEHVARSGWNGKGMFLFFLPGAKVPKSAIHNPALRRVMDEQIAGDTFDALSSVRMFTADKKVLTGWLASQTDMFSKDWCIVG